MSGVHGPNDAASGSSAGPVDGWQKHKGSGVGPRTAPRTSHGAGSHFHKGLDIGMPAGTPIHAVKAGKVVSAGDAGGAGNMTVIDHGDGTFSKYLHQQAIAVHVGQSVRAGEVIGKVGSTGKSTGPHLHFEVRSGHPGTGPVLDPEAFIAGADHVPVLDPKTGIAVGFKEVKGHGTDPDAAPRPDAGKTWGGPGSKRPLNFGHPPGPDGQLIALHPSGVPVWSQTGTAITADQWANMPASQHQAIESMVAPAQRAKFLALMKEGVAARAFTAVPGGLTFDSAMAMLGGDAATIEAPDRDAAQGHVRKLLGGPADLEWPDEPAER